MRSASRAVRKLRSAATTKMVSSRLVLPCPLSPANTWNRAPGASSTRARLRTPSRLRCSTRRSDPHRHDDPEVVVAGQRLEQARVELAAEVEADLVAAHLGQELDDVLRIEADRDRGPRVFGVELLADLAHVRVVARDGDVAALRRELDAARIRRHQRRALERVDEPVPVDD